MTASTSQRGQHVGELYDQLGDLVAAVMGGSLHYGYWADPAEDDAMAVASERMTDLMIRKIDVRAGQRVLDIGCGTGRPALRLARRTGASVLGINIAQRQVMDATQLAAAERLSGQVQFQLMDATDLTLEPASFDAVWLFESLLHMPDAGRVLRQAADVLRPGGRLAISNLVQLGPLNQEQAARLAPLYQTFQIASIIPLADYPALLASCGLLVTELTDISEQSVRKTMRVIIESAKSARNEMSAILDGLPDSKNRFAGTPSSANDLVLVTELARSAEIGYAIITAVTGAPDA